MMLLWWSTLLLCLSANAGRTFYFSSVSVVCLQQEYFKLCDIVSEIMSHGLWYVSRQFLSSLTENVALWPTSVTLKCSSAGCSSSIEGFDGMHLYLYQDQKEPINVFYYHSYPKSTDKVTPGVRFTDRIQTIGSLKDQTITISNLTVEDYGSYRCVYIKVPREVTCNVYTLLIRGERFLSLKDYTRSSLKYYTVYTYSKCVFQIILLYTSLHREMAYLHCKKYL